MRLLGLLLVLSTGSAVAQTIEGFWQDTERRILFAADAPPGYEYGRWTMLDQKQTYPTAKQFGRSAAGYDVVDFLYDDEEALNVSRASEKAIDFTRTNTWSKCVAQHQCELQGANQLLCSIETSCGGKTVWRGEERYIRRASCERVEVRRAQGIPHRCS
jgi:hypothetical protein